MRISDWSSDVCSSDLASGAAVPGSRKGVGHRGLALGDEGLQRLVDAGIDGRRLVVLQRLLPQAVGALVGIAAAFRLPLLEGVVVGGAGAPEGGLEVRSEEHTSELQSLMRISYAVFCLKKKKKIQ